MCSLIDVCLHLLEDLRCLFGKGGYLRCERTEETLRRLVCPSAGEYEEQMDGRLY